MIRSGDTNKRKRPPPTTHPLALADVQVPHLAVQDRPARQRLARQLIALLDEGFPIDVLQGGGR